MKKSNVNRKRKVFLKRKLISAHGASFILVATGIIYLTLFIQKCISALLSDEGFDHFFDFD